MDTEHTPGPWHYSVGDSVVFIRAGKSHAVCQTNTKNYYQKHDSEDLANARLIAAAPDLLEVCELLVMEGASAAVFTMAAKAYEKATGTDLPGLGLK